MFVLKCSALLISVIAEKSKYHRCPVTPVTGRSESGESRKAISSSSSPSAPPTSHQPLLQSLEVPAGQGCRCRIRCSVAPEQLLAVPLTPVIPTCLCVPGIQYMYSTTQYKTLRIFLICPPPPPFPLT